MLCINQYPAEYVLATLKSCLTILLIYSVAAQCSKIVKLESMVSGDLDIQGFLGLSENIQNGCEKS
jgi:hypothetical protein